MHEESGDHVTINKLLQSLNLLQTAGNNNQTIGCALYAEHCCQQMPKIDSALQNDTGEDCSELWTQSDLGWCWNEAIYLEGPPAFRTKGHPW